MADVLDVRKANMGPFKKLSCGRVAAACLSLVMSVHVHAQTPDESPSITVKDRLADAQQLLRRNELHNARDRFQEILVETRGANTLSYEYPTALRALIEINRRLEAPDRVVELFEEYRGFLEKIPNAESSIVETSLLVGDVLMRANRHDEALKLLERDDKTVNEKKLRSKLHLSYLIVLARATTRSGDEEKAVERWLAATEVARRAVDERDNTDKWQGPFSFYVYRLAECYYGISRHKESLLLLLEFLKEQTTTGEQEGRRRTMKFIAAFHRSLQNHGKSNESIGSAITVQKTFFRDDQLNLGALYGDLLRTGTESGLTLDQVQDAEAVYKELLETAEKNDDVELRSFCLVQLASIYRYAARFAEATELTEKIVALRERTLGDSHRRTNDARAELGLLYGKTGKPEQAISLLNSVIAARKSERPQQPLLLASAMSDMASLYQELGRYEDAQSNFQRVVELQRQSLPENDAQLVSSYGNLATVTLARGQFRNAIKSYEEAIEICEHHGLKMKKLLSQMKLSLALAYQSQGQLNNVERHLADAMKLQTEMFGTESFGLVGYYNALAILNRTMGKQLLSKLPTDAEIDQAIAHFRKTVEYCQLILDRCKKTGQTKHLVMASALDQLALVAKQDRNYDQAKVFWAQALAIHEHHQDEGLIAKTLNSLGVIDAMLGNHQQAEFQFRKAREIHSQLQSFPLEQYSVLCNLAVSLYAQSKRDEAVSTLGEAIELTESPRASIAGAEGERAQFFAQFSRAFETMVDWKLTEFLESQGKNLKAIDDAFISAEKGRNRTFLDLLAMGGIDIRKSLQDDAGKELLQREVDLRTQLRAIRAKALQLDQRANDTELKREFARVQQAYSDVWRDIRNSSPLYAEMLSQRGRLAALSEVREHLLGDDELLLIYTLGSQKSWLIIVGKAPEKTRVFSLNFDIAALGNLDAVGDGEEPSKLKIRGFTADEPEPSPNLNLGPPGPLTRELATRLVANNLMGLKGRLKNPDPFRDSKKPEITLGNVIIPPAAREYINQFGAKRLIVVPDGALHQLPFEALVIRSDDEPVFVVDTLPPIAYAPSCNVLLNLKKRAASQFTGLLSVGNPAYPQWDERQTNSDSLESARGAYLDIGGAIPLLPGTARECASVAKLFGAQAQMLTGKDATEKKMVSRLNEVRFLHVAAHGLVDETYQNLFGSLALTPGSGTGTDDDGFLSYNEILDLNLNGCDLAVLSACETNVGPERPMEAGITLAQAFLAAGSSRVLASQWCVSDDSTAILMTKVFEEIKRHNLAGQPIPFSNILQSARKAVRSDPRFAAPFYWAPFVLIGPGTTSQSRPKTKLKE